LASESIVLKSVSPQAQTARITYVLDTSVLLADPIALSRFAEHEVIIPITVIGELETKRDHPELGYFARAALRTLDDLRVKSGRLDKPIGINKEGGTLLVELNHADTSKLPAGFLRDGSNDSRILAIAKNLMSDGRQVVLVTKDLPLRVKASSVGVEAQEYRAELASTSGWSGMVEESVGSTVIDSLYEDVKISNEIAKKYPCHTGVVLHSEKGSALAR
jgi:PhoH-like ATPase